MSDDRDPKLRLRVILREIMPDASADEFSDLVEVLLAADPAAASLHLPPIFDAGIAFVRRVASGLIATTPKFRRATFPKLRGLAEEILAREKA